MSAPLIVRYRGLLCALCALCVILDALCVLVVIALGAWLHALIFAIVGGAALYLYFVLKDFTL